jgi:hypothetical protein
VERLHDQGRSVKSRLFFIHRSSDRPRVLELQGSLRDVLPNLPFEDASPEVPFSDTWQDSARTVIDSCDAVVAVIGSNTHESEPIDWELRYAHETGKPLVIGRLSKDCRVPAACSELRMDVADWSTPQMAGRIGEVLVSKALFGNSQPTGDALWNQYNLMATSWESLITRRQTVNTLYLSAEAALLAGVGVLISASGDTGVPAAAAATMLIGFLGAALSYNWRRTVISYGTLSRAKAKVISAMEAHMPARLFDGEWRVLEAKRYKSTTETDMQTAQFFLLLFVVVTLLAAGVAVSQIVRG